MVSTLSLLLGFLPGFVWLVFYLREDLHPEPKRLIAFTFLTGISFALYALIAENGLNAVLEKFGVMAFSLISMFLLASLEEFFKFGAAYAAVRNNPAFDEPVDAMIYMVVAALGFATLENLGALNFREYTQLALVGSIVETASLRFVGATLLHSLSSAIVGYFWALSIRGFGLKRLLIVGLIAASLLHTVFNFLIIKFGTMVYPIILLAVVGFFVLNDFEKLNKKAV